MNMNVRSENRMTRPKNKNGCRWTTVAIEPWQETILRNNVDTHSGPELADMCQRSRTWVSVALQTLGLESPRARRIRINAAARHRRWAAQGRVAK